MAALLNLIWDICCLRRGPQDLPYSPLLLLALVAISVSYQLMIALLRNLGSFGEVLAGALFGVALMFTVLHVALTLRGMRNRFVQSASALLGCTLVFALLRLPVELLIGTPPATPADITALQALLALVSLPLLGWNVVAYAHVLRHSLDIPFLAGLALSLLWIVIGIALIAATGAAPGT